MKCLADDGSQRFRRIGLPAAHGVLGRLLRQFKGRQDRVGLLAQRFCLVLVVAAPRYVAQQTGSAQFACLEVVRHVAWFTRPTLVTV